MILRKNSNRTRLGATVVESAFVLSILFLFLFGIIEYARYLFVMNLCTNATCAGARYAVAHTGDGTTLSQVQASVTASMSGINTAITGYTVDVFAAQPGVSPPTAVSGANWNDTAFGNGICVRITGTYSFAATTLIGVGSVPVNVSAVMTSEAN